MAAQQIVAGITINYRKIILNNQLNTSYREALFLRTYRRNHVTTMRLVGSVEV